MLRSGRSQLTVAAVALGAVVLGALWYFSDSQAENRAHDEALALWESREPTAYSFDFSYCNGFCAGCRLEITVENGSVTDAEGWEGECPVVDGKPPTIEGIFALEKYDRSRDMADSFEIRYDPYWGFPALVEIRCPEGLTDCGIGYEVTDFEALR